MREIKFEKAFLPTGRQGLRQIKTDINYAGDKIRKSIN